MSEEYRHTQTQVCEFFRKHYGLSDVEALIILDDILLNLDAMVADWESGAERQCPPEWQRGRIAAAVLALGQNMQCDGLVDIGTGLAAAIEAADPPDPDAIAPLRTFVKAMRRAMPDTHRSVAD